MQHYLYTMYTFLFALCALCPNTAEAAGTTVDQQHIQTGEYVQVYSLDYPQEHGYRQEHGQGLEEKHQPWLDSLSEKQRQQAEIIMQKKRPHLHALRDDVRNKVRELQEFSYSENTDMATLTRLGKELQNAREALRKEWKSLDKELDQQLGISISPKRGRGSTNLTKHAFDQYNMGDNTSFNIPCSASE